MFSDDDVAALYDRLCPWGGNDRIYDELVMAADTVLDVGCGTGLMLHHALDQGHRGRLVGLDPNEASLARARRRTGVEWVSGVAADAAWDGEFELATMTGNAFQCFVTDEELAASLAAIHRSLRPGGLFAFDTRHPQARAWETWNPGNATDIAFGSRMLRVSHRVESVVDGVVTMTETTSEDGVTLRVDRAGLRFVEVAELGAFLRGAGFEIQSQYGDWDRGPITPASRTIVTITRRQLS
ncbi:class I SAM-dependent methyltransferase [Nonomuraea sp. NBC_01738]|uniref:class I SAM-dependent methyltransferase n=1 Tax=Nonomuraea sp. NBC_01738 TaxID=2976003 RepID=UPI002E147BE7|nr:class I SAM-dependent methyltransferase [Nonomuraea sp. NBC_01738]